MRSSLEVEGRPRSPWEDETLDHGLEGSVAVHSPDGSAETDKQPRQRKWHCACVSVPVCD